MGDAKVPPTDISPPAEGGSYLADPDSGELTLTERTNPRGASRETTEPECLFLNERNASCHV